MGKELNSILAKTIIVHTELPQREILVIGNMEMTDSEFDILTNILVWLRTTTYGELKLTKVDDKLDLTYSHRERHNFNPL